MKHLKIIFGFLLAMASVWVGSYFLGQVDYNHWSATPTFISTMVGIIGGIALVAWGLCR